VPIGWKAGWAPEPVWTTYRSETLDPTGTRTPTPVAQPVASRYNDYSTAALLLTKNISPVEYSQCAACSPQKRKI
jgi:hypothetical protein